VSQNDPSSLLVGCSDQMLRLFDVRTSGAPALSVHVGRSPLAGMVLDPCGRAGAALAGSTSGELRFLDLRAAGGSGGAGGGGAGGGGETGSCLVRCVQAHSGGGLSVLAAHPNAPLLATAAAAAGGVVKVWTDTGDIVGAIKSAGPQRMAPVTAMAWHPYNLYLGAGGRDSVASVFIVDGV
jgi:WD40 repeat protein